MEANRFSKPIGTVQLGTPTDIPFDAFAQVLGKKQQAYDDTDAVITALEDKRWNNLSADDAYSAAAYKDKDALVENLLGYGDLAKHQGDIMKQIRKFGKRFDPKYGDIGVMNSNHAMMMENIKKIDESEFPEAEKALARQYVMQKYQGLGEGEDKGFGYKTYNTVGSENLPKYFDIQGYMTELAKSHPIEKMAESKGWVKKGNVWFKDSSMRERLTFDELSTELEAMGLGNEKLQDYLNFTGKIRESRFKDPEYQASLKEQMRKNYDATLEKNKDVLAAANDITSLDNLTGKPLQEAINDYGVKLFGDKWEEISEDGFVGKDTKAALAALKDYAKQTLDTKAQMEAELNKDIPVEDLIQQYKTETLRKSTNAVADFYSFDNVIEEDQDMKFDEFDKVRLSADLSWRNKQRELLVTHPPTETGFRPIEATQNPYTTDTRNPFRLDPSTGVINVVDFKKSPTLTKMENDLNRELGTQSTGKSLILPSSGFGSTRYKGVSKTIENLTEAEIKKLPAKTQAKLKQYKAAKMEEAKQQAKPFFEFEAQMKAQNPKANRTQIFQAWEQFYEANKSANTFYKPLGNDAVSNVLRESISKEIYDPKTGTGLLTNGQAYYFDEHGKQIPITKSLLGIGSRRPGLAEDAQVNFHGFITPENYSTHSSGYYGTIKIDGKPRSIIVPVLNTADENTFKVINNLFQTSGDYQERVEQIPGTNQLVRSKPRFTTGPDGKTSVSVDVVLLDKAGQEASRPVALEAFKQNLINQGIISPDGASFLTTANKQVYREK